jgi:hypothetical protein
MPPGQPAGNARARARPKALTARAKKKVKLQQKNTRRDKRREACRLLNALGETLHVGNAVLATSLVESPASAAVEKLVRLLEKRVQTDEHINQLQVATVLYVRNGQLPSKHTGPTDAARRAKIRCAKKWCPRGPPSTPHQMFRSNSLPTESVGKEWC